MTITKETKMISTFSKGDDKITVISVRATKNGQPKFSRYFINGKANPFPCYAMETNFPRIREWLENAGWHMFPEISMKITETDDEMGIFTTSTYEGTLIDRGWDVLYVQNTPDQFERTSKPASI